MSPTNRFKRRRGDLDKAQELIIDRRFDAAREHIDVAIRSGSPEALYLSAVWHAHKGDQDSCEIDLRAAAEAGNVSAIGESARLDLMSGQIDVVIDRLTSVPANQRNASVWVVLSWALLLTDRSNEYLESIDDEGLQAILQEPPAFRLLAGLHQQAQVEFFANHIACAMLNRALTPYEADLLERITEQQERVSELLLLAARLAQVQGDVSHRDSLLKGIPPEEVESLRSHLDAALSLTSPGSRARDHLTALAALLDLDSIHNPLQDIDPSIGTLRLILSDSNTPGCDLPNHDPDRCPRRKAAGNPQMAPDDLSDWAATGDSCLKLGVADNPMSTVEILELLALDDRLPIRNSILDRSELPLRTLILGLLNSWSDENYDDFQSLPAHYDYTKMFRDIERGANESRIKSILEGLASEELLQEAWQTLLTWTDFGDTNHPSDGHMAALAVSFVKNIVTGAREPRWIFESLIDSTNGTPQLRTARVNWALHSGSKVVSSAKDAPLVFQASVAVHLRRLPQDLALEFAQACPWDVRLLLALKSETNGQTLATIFETNPPEFEHFVLDDGSAYFDAGVPWEDLWPTGLGLGSLFEDDYELPEQADMKSAALGAAAQHPNFPPTLLTDAARNSNPVVRAGTARSVNAPQELLRELALDEAPYVRSGVANNPIAEEGIRALALIQKKH